MLLFKNNFNYKIIYILFLLYYFNYKLYEKSVNKNNKNENQSIDINYVKSLKKVVYSALFGNYDKLYPINKENGYDYFLFTNQILTNTSTNWTILNVEKNLNFSNRREVIKTQRFYKTHPHLFFKNYDLSIYIDTTYEIKGELDYFLLRILTPKIGIYVYEHPGILTIYNEFDCVVLFKKETLKNIIPIRERYKKENFPDDKGHAECSLIVRKHNEISCINLMENWYYEIKHNSHRDQLSFNYVLWKQNDTNIKYISKVFIYQYFNQAPVHLKNFEFKDR